MKRFFTLAALAAMFMFSTPTNAQVKFGAKAGLNLTNLSFSQETLNAKNRAGFFIGPTVKFTLPVVGLGVDASALYDQREASVEYATVTSSTNVVTAKRTLRQQQVVVPINLRYSVGLGSMPSVYGFAGPQFGFNIGDKNQTLYEDVMDWRLKTSNFSINVGAGATLLGHLQVSLNYNIACSSTADVNLLGTAADLAQQFAGLKKGSKANAWQLAVAYYF